MIKSVENIKMIYSIILTILSTLLGEHWILFFLYLLLNIADSFTGWAKAHINKNESSWIALVGVIREVLPSLDLTNYVRIFDERSRPKFEISSESKKVLGAFQKKGLIYGYEEDQNKEGYYKIVRTKPAKPLAQELL